MKEDHPNFRFDLTAWILRSPPAFLPSRTSPLGEYRAWLKQFAHWLYSTDHIMIRYEIEYDRLDIRKLSPRTRGIVLLLLYLALDEADDGPLIIDQPEENLDPKSVFDVSIALFIEAKRKRQSHHCDSQRQSGDQH